MSLHETLADDLRLAPAFEEYLVCKVYLEQLERDQKPETSILRNAVRTQIRSLGRRLKAAAAASYPNLDDATISQAASVILERQPVGRDYYLAKLPG